MTLTANLKFFMSQFAKLNRFVVTGRKSLSSKAIESEKLDQLEELEDFEEKEARRIDIENKRNKSNLYPQDYNRQHGKPPYAEPISEHHEFLSYKRRMYGKYGKLSGVDPSILWPSRKELDAMKEYEGVAQPFTIHQMIKKVKDAKIAEAKERAEAESEILKKVANIESEIHAFNKRTDDRKKKIQEAIDKKNALISQVQKHFGYKISVHDEKFKTMLSELEEAERKQAKAAKKAQRAARVLERMESQAKKEEEAKDEKEE